MFSIGMNDNNNEDDGGYEDKSSIAHSKNDDLIKFEAIPLESLKEQLSSYQIVIESFFRQSSIPVDMLEQKFTQLREAIAKISKERSPDLFQEWSDCLLAYQERLMEEKVQLLLQPNDNFADQQKSSNISQIDTSSPKTASQRAQSSVSRRSFLIPYPFDKNMGKDRDSIAEPCQDVAIHRASKDYSSNEVENYNTMGSNSWIRMLVATNKQMMNLPSTSHSSMPITYNDKNTDFNSTIIDSMRSDRPTQKNYRNASGTTLPNNSFSNRNRTSPFNNNYRDSSFMPSIGEEFSNVTDNEYEDNYSDAKSFFADNYSSVSQQWDPNNVSGNFKNPFADGLSAFLRRKDRFARNISNRQRYQKQRSMNEGDEPEARQDLMMRLKRVQEYLENQNAFQPPISNSTISDSICNGQNLPDPNCQYTNKSNFSSDDEGSTVVSNCNHMKTKPNSDLFSDIYSANNFKSNGRNMSDFKTPQLEQTFSDTQLLGDEIKASFIKLVMSCHLGDEDNEDLCWDKLKTLITVVARTIKLLWNVNDETLHSEALEIAFDCIPQKLLLSFHSKHRSPESLKKLLLHLQAELCSHQEVHKQWSAKLQSENHNLLNLKNCCHYCKSFGHLVEDCPVISRLLCFTCYEFGHTVKRCQNKPLFSAEEWNQVQK